MRVCLVSRELMPFTGGGIGTYALQILRALADAGHEVHVITQAHEGLDRAGELIRGGDRIAFHAVDPSSGWAALNAYPNDVMRHSMAVLETLRTLNAGVGVFDYIEFPEYWGEGYFSVRARRTMGLFEDSVIGVRLHTPTRDCRELNRTAWLDRDAALMDHMEEETMRGADVLVSPTESLLENVLTRQFGDARRRVWGGKAPYGEVLRLPFDRADMSELGQAPSDERPDKTNDIPTVLYYGRLEHRKGVHLLVRAACEALDRGLRARFRFIGGDTVTGPFGGSMGDHLRRLIPEEHAEAFVFDAARPRAELGEAIQSASACCFPSIWENSPYTCLESMALGACVIGSSAGGMGEIIEDGVSGLVFESGDVGSLSVAIERMLTDGALRARVRENAPARVDALCEPAKVAREAIELVERVRARREPNAGGPATAQDPGDAPLVSVIVPFYNSAAWLPETLASLRAQTFTGFETLIVDDGSTEPDSLAMLDMIEREGACGDFGLRVVRKPNGGLSSARNAGVRAARGRWVVPLDSDDIIEPAFIERCLDAARRDAELAFVTTLVAYFREDPGEPHAGWVALGHEPDMLPFMNVAGVCTALIRRDRILEAGGYDEWMTSYEDWDLYCTFAERGWRGTVVPEFLFRYRVRSDSMMRTEGMPKREMLRAYLAEKHAALPHSPDRTLRLALGEIRQLRAAGDFARAEAHRARQRIAQLERELAHLHSVGVPAAAGELVRENVRYRIADRVNETLKAMRLQSAVKAVTVRAFGMKEDAHEGAGSGQAPTS